MSFRYIGINFVWNILPRKYVHLKKEEEKCIPNAIGYHSAIADREYSYEHPRLVLK